jgi:hypothetical protein
MGAKIIMPWIKYLKIFFKVSPLGLVAPLLIKNRLAVSKVMKRKAVFRPSLLLYQQAFAPDNLVGTVKKRGGNFGDE